MRIEMGWPRVAVLRQPYARQEVSANEAAASCAHYAGLVRRSRAMAISMTVRRTELPSSTDPTRAKGPKGAVALLHTGTRKSAEPGTASRPESKVTRVYVLGRMKTRSHKRTAPTNAAVTAACRSTDEP